MATRRCCRRFISSIISTFHTAQRDEEKDAHGNLVAGYTQWTTASDLRAWRYYFRTHENSQIRSIDLMKMQLDAKDIAKISTKGPEAIKPLTPEAPN
jgi:choloylglycine hydrolase